METPLHPPPFPEVSSNERFELEEDQPKLVNGRKVAILVAAGVAVDQVESMQSALKSENVLSEIVGPHIGDIEGTGGATEATKTFANSSSVLFDAIYVPGGKESVESLQDIPDALRFVDEAPERGKRLRLAVKALS